MVILLRSATAALVLVFAAWGHDGAAAPVTPPQPASPAPDVALDALMRGISWDAAIDNDFSWLFADPQITTACDDVRAPFPEKVAAMGCAVSRPGDRRRALRRTAAFFGGGSGGGSGLRLAGVVANAAPASSPEIPAIPLPGGAVLLATALGGLALGQLSRGRRGMRRSAPA